MVLCCELKERALIVLNMIVRGREIHNDYMYMCTQQKLREPAHTTSCSRLTRTHRVGLIADEGTVGEHVPPPLPLSSLHRALVQGSSIHIHRDSLRARLHVYNEICSTLLN